MNAPAFIEPVLAAPADASLTPAQDAAYREVIRLAAVSPLVSIVSDKGLGKTTILNRLAKDYGGELVSPRECLEAIKLRDPEASDEAIFSALSLALDRTDLLLVDGMDLAVANSNVRMHAQRLFIEAIFDRAVRLGKRIVMAAPARLGPGIVSPTRIATVEISSFRAADYTAIVRNLRGSNAADALNADLLFRTEPGLSGHDLREAYAALGDVAAPTFADVQQALAAQGGSNTHMNEIEELSFASLPGTEHISSKLETHILLPLENKALAQKLDIRPKRGVLLYGPPGTGKTSIGRALAHRMKGKFFLIDGSVVTEPPVAFFSKVKAIVEEAKANAPCVLFIDDADVLFGIVHISGLARYLLSLLDGMESETAGKVCLMMTAMDPKRVPAALLRSGRVELWLETRTPDAKVRAAILKRWLGKGLPGTDTLDLAVVARETERFTAADLRRIVADAKALYAADSAAGSKTGDAEAYLLQAIRELIDTRSRMADNLRDESLRIGSVPVAAKYASGIGGLASSQTGCATKGW